MLLRYDRFSSGTYVCSSTVERQLVMSGDGQTISGEIHDMHFDLDGSVASELCGEGTSVRLH
jgi:hypothetical protein